MALYPEFHRDKSPYQLTTYLVAILGALLIPLVASRIYKVRLLIPILIWTSCTTLALILNQAVEEGSPDSGFAQTIFPYQLLAILLTIGFIAINKRRKT